MIGLEHYLVLAALVFSIGFVGMVLNRNNLIAILMCIELMLLAVNINFVAIDHFLNSVDGQVMVFFILAVAASEAAIGLAIFIVLYQMYQSIETDRFSQLKG
jgi:NADH-quinone oxidoreductase subunit K